MHYLKLSNCKGEEADQDWEFDVREGDWSWGSRSVGSDWLFDKEEVEDPLDSNLNHRFSVALLYHLIKSGQVIWGGNDKTFTSILRVSAYPVRHGCRFSRALSSPCLQLSSRSSSGKELDQDSWTCSQVTQQRWLRIHLDNITLPYSVSLLSGHWDRMINTEIQISRTKII